MALIKYGLIIQVFDPASETMYRIIRNGSVFARGLEDAREILNCTGQDFKKIDSYWAPNIENPEAGRWMKLDKLH